MQAGKKMRADKVANGEEGAGKVENGAVTQTDNRGTKVTEKRQSPTKPPPHSPTTGAGEKKRSQWKDGLTA